MARLKGIKATESPAVAAAVPPSPLHAALTFAKMRPSVLFAFAITAILFPPLAYYIGECKRAHVITFHLYAQALRLKRCALQEVEGEISTIVRAVPPCELMLQGSRGDCVDSGLRRASGRREIDRKAMNGGGCDIAV